MNEKTAKIVAETLENLTSYATEETADKIVVSLDNDSSWVSVYPARANSGEFYHVEELADVCRAFRVNCWIGLCKDGVVVHIH